LLDQPSLLNRMLDVPRRRLSVAEYDRMGEAGILGPDDRVELIEGELIAMAPIGSYHAGTVAGLTHGLVAATGGRAVVWVQNPIHLDDHNEPQPDFALLRPRADGYRDALPRPADVLLMIEVADSSLAYDRTVKANLYARSGIPELWIVDLAGARILVHRDPSPEGYRDVTETLGGTMLEPSQLPGVRIGTDTLFR
jgi:Uma2 family endonuclease